jgi:hypothetical protein
MQSPFAPSYVETPLDTHDGVGLLRLECGHRSRPNQLRGSTNDIARIVAPSALADGALYPRPAR